MLTQYFSLGYNGLELELLRALVLSEMETVELVSQKGNAKKFHDGYVYDFDKQSENGDVKFWRCELSRSSSLKCKCRLHTDAVTGRILQVIGGHSHAGNPGRREVLEALDRVRERAVNSQENSNQVVRNCVQNISRGARAQLPSNELMKQMVRRKRKQENQAPPAPQNLADLVIPDEWKVYERNPGVYEDFLLFDSGPGADRILIFSTAYNLHNLHNSTEWYCDGTFRVSSRRQPNMNLSFSSNMFLFCFAGYATIVSPVVHSTR